MINWVSFDADDTLWHCEHHFMASHDLYCEIVAPFTKDLVEPEATARRMLAEIETANITRFGYGVKGATLSMIEAALTISEHRIDAAGIQRLIDRHPRQDTPSDVLPVLELGGWAILVPFADTWAHEHGEAAADHPRFEVSSLREVPDVVRSIRSRR